MRQINLLPPEIAQRRRVRETTLLIGAAGLVLVGLLVVVFIVQTARLAGERNKLQSVKRQNAALQVRVNQLQSFAQDQAALQNKKNLLATLTQNEVRWSVILSDLSIKIPSEVWLTSFTGTVQAPPTSGPNVATQTVGTVSFNGTTFTHLDVAKWLTRLADVNEFSFPYLTLSAKGGGAGTTSLVTFNSTVDLSPAALRRNQPGGARVV